MSFIDKMAEDHRKRLAQEKAQASPVSDFSRFYDLVVTAVEGGTETDKEAALEELSQDLANIEVLAQVAYLLNKRGDLHEYYEAVWTHKS